MADIAYPVTNGAYDINSQGALKSAVQEIVTTSTVNADNVDVTLFEDTNNDGSTDNKETFTLTGGSESFTPSNLDLSAGNYLHYRVTAIDGDSDVTTALSNLDVTVNY